MPISGTTLEAFRRGAEHRGDALMVLDWDKVVDLIIERKPRKVDAGLQGDWFWTGGPIWDATKGSSPIIPLDDGYRYLTSTWAPPLVIIDDVDEIELVAWAAQHPDWGAEWPEEAIKRLVETGICPAPAG